jgi:hypothetical protein
VAPGIRLRLDTRLQPLRISPVHALARAVVGRGVPLGLLWSERVRSSIDTLARNRSEARLLAALYGRTPGRPGTEAPGLGREFVDLSIEGSLVVETRTDRTKNHRCAPWQLQDLNSGCQGRFTAPRVDNELVLQAGGLIGQRLHVNIDYDNKRDFNAINDIRVYYQGLPDEVVQRVEVGTVTFTPPPSRFITAAIPAYSFGINTRFEVGPLTIGALAASQKGSTVTERTYVIGQTTSQPQDRSLRDLDFEQGRFYWIVDPTQIAGYPAVDILNVSGTVVPDALRPTEVRIYRYRPTAGTGVNAGLGGITATGYRPEGPQQRTGKVQWSLLVAGQDYVLDQSGLWFAFANRLDANDYLAVSYRTADGTLVGSFPATDNPAANDSLLLLVEPRNGPDVPTFRHEMRQIYRIAGTDLDRSSLAADLVLGRSERPLQGSVATFLALLGLAIPTDPDRLDVEDRVFPRPRDALASQVMREAYIVFPHLTPFADATLLAPEERTDSLYQVPQYLVLTQGPPTKFQFRLRYNAAGGGERGAIDLNAFQIRPGSERIYVAGRPLEPGVDYSISYELGRVTFIDPDALFGTGTATVTARFEERGIFAVAPTTILGLTTSYRVGQAGSFHAIGIYQQENTVFNRPPVGFEPTANLVGGVTGDFRFQPTWPTRFLNTVVTGGTEAPSGLDLKGEFAFTAPQGNRAGQAYLEEFEGGAGIAVSLRETAWEFSSVPEHGDGFEAVGIIGPPDSADAVQVTWQNLVPGSGGQPVEVRTQDIDSLVRISGGASPIETVLYLTMHADTAGGFVDRSNDSRWTLPRRDLRPRWRSMVTPISVTGTDLSQSEFFEFWVFQGASATADSAGVQLIIDIGKVGEDALSIAPASLTVIGGDSTWSGRRYAGRGRLDTERQPSGFFNAQADDIGILVDRPDSLVVNGVPVEDAATCDQSLGSAVQLFPWGDLSVRCTRGNGVLNTEDLNGDNVLDAAGPGDDVFRYVVQLGDPQYFVRNGGAGWKLYRVPLRQEGIPHLGAPNLRLVQHLRITLAAPADAGVPDLVGRFALARMRFLGSPWVRRTDKPVVGLSGALAEPDGEVIVSTVSTENGELGYEPPPGVFDESGRSDATRGQQINERSLRIIGKGLGQGERAEGYLRFFSGPQNLLKYRTLRFWARGRGAGWNDGRLEAVFKVASDDRNFYAYRAAASTTTWEPEIVVDLERWRTLRAEVELRWLQGEAPSGAALCGGDSTAYVACDGPYMVQVADPGINPPNLAAVQEIDAAVYYAGVGADLTEAELWIDDIRLVDPINTLGTAAAFSGRLTAADVADVTFAYTRQDGHFQQVGRDATFRTTATAQFGANVRLDRFLPRSLGVTIPSTVAYTTSSVDPILVAGSDLRAAELDGLRRPASSQITWGIGIRRSQAGKSFLMRTLVDPVSLSGSLTRGSTTAELSESRNTGFGLGGNYQLSLPRRGPALPLDGVIAALPKFLRESPVGEGMKGSILALAPTRVRFGSDVARSEFSFTSYRVAVARPDDSLSLPTLNLTHTWRNNVGLTFQPLGMLTLDGALTSLRDLRHYSDSTPLGRLVGAERREFLGLDAGVERDRQLTTSLAMAPRVASWLRPRFIRSSSFGLRRNLTSRDPVREEGDSGAFVLPQSYNNTQDRELGVGLDIHPMLSRLVGDSSPVTQFLRRARPLDLSVRDRRSSSYDLATFDPDLGYMLAVGGNGEFLTQDGEPALFFNESHDRRIAGGAELPFGITIALSWAEVTSRNMSLSTGGYSETVAEQIEWPQGNVRWQRSFRGGILATMQLGATLRRREGVTTTPSVEGASRGKVTSATLSPDLLLALKNGMAITVSYQQREDLNESNANRTENTSDIWTGSLSHTIRLPASLSALRRPLRVSLYGRESIIGTCLFLTADPAKGCRTVADIRQRTISGGFTTEVMPLAEGSLNVQYLRSDLRHVNQFTTQLSIVASLRVQLSTGEMR